MAKAIKQALTKEQLIKGMSESRTKLADLVSKYNNEESAAAAAKIEEDIKTEKKQYNEYSQSLVLTRCLEEDKPIIAACKVSVYPSLATRMEKNDAGVKVMRLKESTDLLDLTRFAKTITNPWRYRAELLCLFQTKESASSIGVSDKQYMADLERFFKLSEEARKAPKASKRSTATILKEVVSSMIGEEYGKLVVAADVNKFVCGFTQDNRRTRDEIQTANFRQTVKLLTDICHRILTEGVYHIRTKQVSKDGKTWQETAIAGKPATAEKQDTPVSENKDGAVSEKKDTAKSTKKAPKAPKERKASAKASK